MHKTLRGSSQNSRFLSTELTVHCTGDWSCENLTNAKIQDSSGHVGLCMTNLDALSIGHTYFHPESINQSIIQSVSQLINQSVNQSINQSIN